MVIKWLIDVCPTTCEEAQQSAKQQWHTKIPRKTLLVVKQPYLGLERVCRR
jgi:hypothetical protein